MAKTVTEIEKLRVERERIDKRIRAIEERTGKKLKGKAAPAPITRGATLLTGKSKNKTVIRKKPTSVIGVMAGRETRLKVEQAVQ